MNRNECFAARLMQSMGRRSARSVALESGISESVLRKYMAGESSPNVDRLVKLADVLQVPIEWLTTGVGPMSLYDIPEWIKDRTIKLKGEINALAITAEADDSDGDGCVVCFDPSELKKVQNDLDGLIHSLALKMFQQEPNGEAKPSKNIDLDLLQTVIAEIEDIMAESNRGLTHNKKAQLICAVYDLYSESNAKPEKEKVLRLVKLAA